VAVTVNFVTKIISINKVDMVLIQSTPTEIYQLDMDVLRTTLNDIMDNADGIVHDTIISHNAGVTVSGAILAQVIQFINGYTITFEDAQYAVNIVGANTDLGDKVNVNQVSVRTSNSAGLQDLNSLQAASFSGAVAIDVTSSFTGTTFPVGTRDKPVNNLADALSIAQTRGIAHFNILRSMTIDTVDFSNGFVFRGDNVRSVIVTIAAGANVTDCEFQNMTIMGTLDNNNQIRQCLVFNVTQVNGTIKESALLGTITIAPPNTAVITECFDGTPGNATGEYAIIDMNGASPTNIIINDFSGDICLQNCTAAAKASIIMSGGLVVLKSSITAGTFDISGIAEIQNNVTGTATVANKSLVRPLTTGEFIALS
jgi:hypothetical protein